jgi:hypothetical protein
MIRLGFASHLALLGLLTLGALLGGRLGRDARTLGALLAAAGGLLIVVMGAVDPGALPGWVIRQYPPAVALGMACYGVLTRERLPHLAALLVLSAWSVTLCWSFYAAIRDRVTGLDAIALGLILLVLAQLISLAKAGLLPAWLSPLKRETRELAE